MDWILHGASALAGIRGDLLAGQLHAVAATAVLLAWIAPIVTALFRQAAHAEPEIDWVQLWRCPNCSTFNRRATLNCSHCDYALKTRGLAKYIPLKVSEAAKRFGRKTLFLYVLAGWMAYYGITLVAVWKLQLYQLHQPPAAEFLGSFALLLILAGVIFFRHALRPRFKPPIAALLNFFAGSVMMLIAAGLILGTTLSANKPGATLARLAVPAARPLALDVEYAVFSWPAVGYRNLTVTRIGAKPRLANWQIHFIERFAGLVQKPAGLRPTLTLARQSIPAPPGKLLAIYELASGGGLGVQSIADPTFPKR
jgi:hypothetical protein